MTDSGAYLRNAESHEFDAASFVIARAFSNDPLLNWMGSVKRQMPRPGLESTQSDWPKEFLSLYFYYDSLSIATHIMGGHVLLVIIPDSRSAKKERIAAVSLWTPPGKSVASPLTILRSKQWRAMFGHWSRLGGWGFSGLKVSSRCHNKCTMS